MSVPGGSSLARALLAFAATGCLGAGFAACRSDAVIIGIETDGGPLQLNSPPPPLGHDAAVAPAPSGSPWAFGDSGYEDADEGPCLPDGGCGPGASCYYFLLDAGCPLPGECFLNGNPAEPPPPPPPPPQKIELGAVFDVGRSGRPQHVPRVFGAPYGYTSVRPSCDAGDLAAPPEAADGGSD